MANDVHACRSSHITQFLLAQLPPTGKGDRANQCSAYEKCWGEILKKKFEGVRGKSIAKRTGELFEGTILRLLMSYNSRPVDFSKVFGAIDFFFKPYKFISTNGGLNSPLACLVVTFRSLGRHRDELTGLIEKVLHFALQQHVFDPPEYVSHGFDHSLKVAEYCEMLSQHVDGSLKYGLKDTQFVGVMKILAYLHDCGYPHLRNRVKTTHSVLSADQVSEIIPHLQQILQLQQATFERLITDFRSAIFSHNADDHDNDIEFKHKLPSETGFFLIATNTGVEDVQAIFEHEEPGLRPVRLKRDRVNGAVEVSHAGFKGRKMDLLYPNDSKIGLQEMAAQTSENAFHWVRLADNLDIAYERSSESQRKEEFKRLYRLRYFIARGKSQHEDVTALEKECNELIQESKLQGIEGKINQDSFKHFGGLEPIIRVSGIQMAEKLTITVMVNRGVWDELNQYSFHEKYDDHPYPTSIAKYQMFRTWKAAGKIFRTWITDGPNPKEVKKTVNDGLQFNIVDEKGDYVDVYIPSKTTV